MGVCGAANADMSVAIQDSFVRKNMIRQDQLIDERLAIGSRSGLW